MTGIVKRATSTGWTSVVAAGLLGLAAVGQANAASVAFTQKQFDKATGQTQSLSSTYDGTSGAMGYAPSDPVSDACTHGLIARKYNQC